MQPTEIKATRVSELLDRVFPPDFSYIEPRILTKGGTLLLGGGAKTGKSFCTMEMCRALSTGHALFDNTEFRVPNQARVVYVDAEVGAFSDQERLRLVMGADDRDLWRDYLYIITKEDQMKMHLQLDTLRGIGNYKALIRDCKPDVIILDPISFLFHRPENDATEIGKLFYTLAELKACGGNETSLVFTHHFSKKPWGSAAIGYDPLSEYNFRGSSKWKDGGDSLMTMQRTKDISDTSWELKMRFLTRHGASPPEGYAVFNADGDLRTKWSETVHKLPKLKKINVPATAPLEKQNYTLFDTLGFEEGHTSKKGSYGDND